MTNKPIQPAVSPEIGSSVVPQNAPQNGPHRGPIGLSEYFDRAGMLWIALCLTLTVGAGHLIPRADSLLRQSAHPNHQRLDVSRMQAPAAPGATPSGVVSSAISGQPTGPAISATGPQKVW